MVSTTCTSLSPKATSVSSSAMRGSCAGCRKHRQEYLTEFQSVAEIESLAPGKAAAE